MRCTSTRRDGAFVRLDLDGDVDGNDLLAFSLRCEDADFAEAARWIQGHCAVFLGHADNNQGAAEGSPVWGACPGVSSSAAVPRCTSSGFDGNFRAMQLAGDVDENDDLGLAWICRDDEQPARAAAAQASAEVQLAWSAGNQGPGDGAPTWGFDCPGSRRLQVGRVFRRTPAVAVTGELGLAQGDCRVASALTEPAVGQARAATRMHRCTTHQVGQSGGGAAVATVGGSDQAEQGGVLRDRQQLAVTKGPASRCEVPRKDSDLGNKGF